MKRIMIVVFLVFPAALMTEGQNRGLKHIGGSDLTAYMEFLASDELRGRETGTNENNIAALYIESNLRRMGLKAPFDNGSYLQRMEFVSKRILKTSLSLSAASGEPVFSTDSLLILFSGPDSIDLSGELVFAGYGFEDQKTGYSDLRDVDIRNRMVLVMTRNPAMVDSSGADNNYVLDEMSEGEKISSLIMRGPKAILMVYDPESSYSDPYESGLAGLFDDGATVSLRDYQMAESPSAMFFITKYAADRLISTSGLTLKELQERIDTGGTPHSSVIGGISVKVTVHSELKEFSGFNVIGLIEGSDPQLKDECIIYTAHFDHIGVNKEGEIMNGADDNASGTAGLMEVADAFSHLRKKPPRSVVFAWVNGEEKGLLGSGYYVMHPVKPIDKTIADINFDMIGRSITPADTGEFFGSRLNVTGTNEIQLYSDNLSEEFRKIVLRSAGETGVSILNMGKEMEFGSSDYASLSSKGVPWMFFHSGIHADLHAPGDDIEKIDFGKMEKVSKLAFLAGYRIASAKKK